MANPSLLQLFLDSLGEAVQKGYCYSRNKEILRLTETGKDATCTWVELQMGNAEYIAFKFDTVINHGKNQVNEPLLIFNEKEPLRSKCDYLIFIRRVDADGKEKFYAMILNMKSGRKANSSNQILAGRALANYILQTTVLAHNHWNAEGKSATRISMDDFFREVNYREILVSNLPPQKRNTNPSAQKPRPLECGKRHTSLGMILS